VTILGAVAGVALYVAVIRRWFAGAMAPWMDASRSGLAARLVIGGAALATVGWLGNVTYGVWLFEAGSEVLTLILLAAVVAVAAADTDAPLKGRAAVIAAIVLVAFAALIALQHTLVFIEEGFGIDDWIPQIAYVAGVVVQVIGVALWTRDEFSAEIASATSRPSDDGPTAGGGTAAM
jgi:hypothetical protein